MFGAQGRIHDLGVGTQPDKSMANATHLTRSFALLEINSPGYQRHILIPMKITCLFLVWALAIMAQTIRDYGAAGDGVHDDSAAIQKAFDALDSKRGGVVDCPVGAYAVYQTITVHGDSVRLAGDGGPATNEGPKHSHGPSHPRPRNSAGIRIPPGITGRSLGPLVERKGASWRTTLVSEIAAARMLRSGGYKYVRYRPERNLEMLFDLKNDPEEVRSLVEDPASHSALVEHRDKMDAWMKASRGSFEAVDEDMRRWFHSNE